MAAGQVDARAGQPAIGSGTSQPTASVSRLDEIRASMAKDKQAGDAASG